MTAVATSAATESRPYEVVCSSEDRDAWLRARRTGIGASEVAAVFGESRWKSAIELYADKIGGERTDDEATEAQFWGLRLERIIADVFAARTGRTIEWSGLMLRSKAHPWALATLDAQNWEHQGDSPWPLDSKTASVFKQGEWYDGPPREYYLQAQQQMLVTGAPRATLACLLGGQRLVWCDVERNDIEIRRIVHAGRLFWDKCVTARTPPAPDGSDSASHALQRIYPEGTNACVQLGAEFETLYDELTDLKAHEKQLESRRAEIEARFKAALGTAELGFTPTGNSVSWKSRRGSIDYKRAVEALGVARKELEQYRREPTRVLLQHASKER